MQLENINWKCLNIVTKINQKRSQSFWHCNCGIPLSICVWNTPCHFVELWKLCSAWNRGGFRTYLDANLANLAQRTDIWDQNNCYPLKEDCVSLFHQGGLLTVESNKANYILEKWGAEAQYSTLKMSNLRHPNSPRWIGFLPLFWCLLLSS